MEVKLNRVNQAFHFEAESDSKIKVWIRNCIKLPGKNDERFKEMLGIIKKSDIWNKIESIDTWDLIKLIEQGEISEDMLKKLNGFIREEKIERLYLSNR